MTRFRAVQCSSSLPSKVYGATMLTDAAAACCFEDLDSLLFVPCTKYGLDPTVNMDERKIEVTGNYLNLCQLSLDIWSRQIKGMAKSSSSSKLTPKRRAPLPSLTAVARPKTPEESPVPQSPLSSNPFFEPITRTPIRTKATTLRYVQEKMHDVLSNIESICHVRFTALPSGDDPTLAVVTVEEISDQSQVEKAYDDVEALYTAVGKKVRGRTMEIPAPKRDVVKRKCSNLTTNAILEVNETGSSVTIIGQEDDVAALSLQIEEILRSHPPTRPPPRRPQRVSGEKTGERIAVKKGDIVRERVDVIVVATPTKTFLTSDLRQRVIREGGDPLELACGREIEKMEGKPTAGRMFFTTAGKLPCGSIIHSILPGMEGKSPEKRVILLKQVYFSALEVANRIKATSVAVSLPESIPIQDSAIALPSVVNQYFEAMGEATTVRQVVFVCETLASVELFTENVRSPKLSSANAEEATPDVGEEKECIICFKSVTEKTYLPCAHGFCRDCISDWLKRQTKCPMCDLEVSPDDVL